MLVFRAERERERENVGLESRLQKLTDHVRPQEGTFAEWDALHFSLLPRGMLGINCTARSSNQIRAKNVPCYSVVEILF